MASQQEVPGSSGSSMAGTSQQSKSYQYKVSGNEKFNANLFKEAIVEYKKGLMHDISNSELHLNLAVAYMQVEKYVEASEHAIYSIRLKPQFYKGYLQAAKAAHGKRMTNYAIKMLRNGLKMVSDPVGVKELNKLLHQYNGFMSLRCNAELEEQYTSDTNEADDDHDTFSDDNDTLPPMPPLIPASEFRRLKSMEASCGCATHTLSKLTENDKYYFNDNGGTKIPNSKIEKTNENLNTNTSHHSKRSNKKVEEAPTTETLLSVNINKSTEQDQNTKVFNSIKEDIKPSMPADAAMPLDHVKVVSKQKNDAQNMKGNISRRIFETNNPDSKVLTTEFNDYLKGGSEAFKARDYRKAADCFRHAEKRLISHEIEMDERQLTIIRYVYSTALINLETYDDIIKGIQALKVMESYYISTIPAIYAQMTQAYCKLNRYKAAASPLAQLHKLLDDCPIFPTFTWPGTNEIIEETTPSGLKKYIGDLTILCNITHKPTAVCRYDDCNKISTHIVPSEFIYNSDPDFIGYVRMTCEDKCSIEFHISCWKAYKESTVKSVGKINDKELLGHRCLTTDCINSLGKPSVIVSIDIIGTDRKVKSSSKLDPKTALKTSKKRKLKIDEEKNKDKEKEKASKSKKIKEKKLTELKKNQATMDDDEDLLEDDKLPGIDLGKALPVRNEALEKLRTLHFGLRNNEWTPKLNYYGTPEEMLKCTNNTFLDSVHNDTIEVRDAKEFLFSYFMTMIRDEGPMKIEEIEEQWKESAGDFCDISIVLPNLKSMRALLLESTIFCQVENYICLSDQLEEQYEEMKNDTNEVVSFFVNGSIAHHEGLVNAKTALPDQLDPQSDSKLASQSSSDAEYDSNEEDSDYDLAVSDDDESESIEQDEGQQSKEPLPEESFKSEIASNTTDTSFVDILLNEMTRVKSNLMKHSAESGTTNQEPLVLDGKSFINRALSDTEKQTVLPPISDFPDFSYDEYISNEDNTSDEDTLGDREMKSETIKLEDVPNKIVSDLVKQNLNAVDSTKLNHSDQIKTLGYKVDNIDMLTNNIEGNSENHDKESQCETVPTKNGEMQTSSSKTKDTITQTKESDYCVELKKQLEVLQSKLEKGTRDNIKLQKEVTEKNFFCSTLKTSMEEMQNSYQKTITALKDENRRKEAELKKKEQLQSKNLEKMNSLHAKLTAENTELKKEILDLNANHKKLQTSLETTTSLLRESEEKVKTLETRITIRSIMAQKAQLNLIKLYWEKQTNLLRHQCVEKISEMQSWFTMCPPEEVEQLPSLGDIRLNIMQWSEISKAVPQLEATVQANFIDLAMKIDNGQEVGDLSLTILPNLPEEPRPLLMDKIHKEITEKHLKKIEDLTQIVVKQQLEIKKIQESMTEQRRNTFQVSAPARTQSPMTTAFGGLALKYPYPQFNQTSASNVTGHNTEDSVKEGSESKLHHSDVKALLQECSKATGHSSVPSIYGTLGMSDSSTASPFPIPNLFTKPPPPIMPPTHVPPPLCSVPPPTIGVAQNLLKTSLNINEKKGLPLVPPPSVKTELPTTSSSRESTPMALQSTVPTPEKDKKKKKKNKSEISTASANTSSMASDISLPDSSAEHSVADAGDWNLVLPKSAVVKQPIAAAPVTESKLKNKKRLLDKLQQKFPHSSIKELDDIVKFVREQNNGSLSGLTFNEIESRVERVVVKKQYNKTSSYGLEKLSSSAWGVIKQQESIGSSVFQTEECIICLEALGLESTKTECNHQFHTKCLRKWLKEKRVCPLCNKFTTMPDEFPAL